MKNSKYFLIFAIAIFIKISLFIFVTIYAPESKFEIDSGRYIQAGNVLYSRGVFATEDAHGSLMSEVFRTPGYPVFLLLLHDLMKVPWVGVIFLQVILTLLTGLIVYKAGIQIDSRIGFLSAVFVLFDLPVSIFSLMLMTEALFLTLIALFIFCFIFYLKKRSNGFLVLSALVLVAATYVRPITYYLGAALAFFIFYSNIPKNFKKALAHALVFLVVVYALLGVWQLRNIICCQETFFSSSARDNLGADALFKSYPRNQDPFTKGMSPFPYYANVSLRACLSLMTRPGSLKYFKVYPLVVAGKIFGYPWVVFWMTGFLAGVLRIGRNIYYQFLLLVILYFVPVTIALTALFPGERFRVPLVPCLAIISAYGWVGISSWIKKKALLGA